MPSVSCVSSAAMHGTTPVPLGQRLRELRGDIGLRELERRTGIDHGVLSRWESGRRIPSPDFLVRLLDALDVEDQEREQLLAMVQRPGPGKLVAGVPSAGRQLAQLIGHERAATRITEVALTLVPGILQTRDYARAVIGDWLDTDRRVRMRMERSEILTRTEDPVELRVIVHVQALTSLVAPPAVMAEQMQHLRRMAELPNVTIQVVPDDVPGWMPSLAGPFIVIEFSEETPIVHVEHYRGGVFVWEPDDVRSFMTAADEMAEKAMTLARSAEVIAQLAGMERHP